MTHIKTLFFIFLLSSLSAYSAPVSPEGGAGLMSRKTGVTFDKALPEDISNENFPDIITGFDFPDATLFDLVKAIGKHTGINFILDNDLKSKRISIMAPSQITVAEAYKAFLSALSVHGYTLVKTGAFWKIQTTEKSHKDNIEVYSGDYFPNTDQLITRIIKLKHINSKDFVDSVKFLLSQNDKIKAHESSNSIIVSDYGSVIEKIMKIVYEMDIPGAEEQIEFIPINHASVEEVAQILEELLSDKKKKASGSRLSKNNKGRTNVILSLDSKSSSSGQVKVSKIISDVRTNSLVVSANKAGLQRVKELIKKIDRRVDPSRIGGVYVYHVLHGTAEDVYNTLMGIQSPTKAPSTGSASNRRNYRPSRRPYSGRSSSRGSSSLFQNVTIMPDTNTNSLIISAAKKYEYERVLEVLKKIDVPRDQVFIQAIILEMMISKNKTRNVNLAGVLGDPLATLLAEFSSLLGTETNSSVFKEFTKGTIAGFLNDSIGFNSIQTTQFGPGLILSQSLNSILGDNLNIRPTVNKSGAGDNQNISEDYSQINQLQLSFLPVVRLLNNVDNVNVLSTPQITTLDNVEAQIEIGSSIPIGLTSTLSGAGLSSTSPERGDILLKLTITPRINPKLETIQMKIEQQFDDIGEQNSVPSELRGQAAAILKRLIKTEMVLHNGETAVLGGLLSDTNSNGKNKVPLLGDVPFLGWMFRGETTKTEKRNLLVFITPTIIKGSHNKQSHRDIVNKKIEERIRFIQKHMGNKDPHKDLLDDLIPSFKEVREKYEDMQDKEEIEDSTFSFFKPKKAPAPIKNTDSETGDSYTEESAFEDSVPPENTREWNDQELIEELDQELLEQTDEEGTGELNEGLNTETIEDSAGETGSYDGEIENSQFQEWVEVPDENSVPTNQSDFTTALEPEEGSQDNSQDSSSDSETSSTNTDGQEEAFIPLDL